MSKKLSAKAELDLVVKCQHMKASERKALANTFSQFAKRRNVPQELRDCAQEMAKIARSAGGKGSRWARG